MLVSFIEADMVEHGKVVACGAISGYTKKEPIYNYFFAIVKRLVIQVPLLPFLSFLLFFLYTIFSPPYPCISLHFLIWCTGFHYA